GPPAPPPGARHPTSTTTGGGVVSRTDNGPGAAAEGFRLIALDIDDTLLGLDKRLAPRDVEAVRRCRAAGIEVILATGRTRLITMPVARQIADDLPMICPTGGVDRKSVVKGK